MASSRKNSIRGGRRTRSRSPKTRQQSVRVRDELPRRETRRSSSSTLSLSSRDHRIPIDCPWPKCNARTVHQHNNLLQFFNPHPENEIEYRGYVSSHRVAPWQADVAPGELKLQAEISDEETIREQSNGQTSDGEDDETDEQEEPLERRTLIVTLKVAAPEENSEAQRLVASADLWKEQQGVVILNRVESQGYTVMDDGTSALTPGDPITSRRTLDFVEDLLTSRQESSMNTQYETVANAWTCGGIDEEPQESPLTISPGLQNIFDEWLVSKTPEQAS